MISFRQSCLKRTLQKRSYGGSSIAMEEKKTPLYDFHIQHKGKMVPFAGWIMPVQYGNKTLVESHLHTRTNVSLFDVSHMLQTKVYGKHRVEFMESLTPADVGGLKTNRATLTVFTNEQGGIKDDLIVTKTNLDHLYVVTNAGCIDKDVEHMQSKAKSFRDAGKDVIVEPQSQEDRCLIAVQGPKAMEVLYDQVSIDLMKFYFMSSVIAKICGIDDCRISRCGYTGEDGFEISVDSKRAVELCEILLKSTKAPVDLAGLGARDSLRLEAGLCLYGNDIDETTSPVEANLAWLIDKNRRSTGGFPGADVILHQLKSKSAQRKRVGFVAAKGRPPRAGANILDHHNNVIGRITSGSPSPSIKKNIAMGYVPADKANVGEKVSIDLAGNGQHIVEAEIIKMPFLPTHYFMPPKK